MTRWPDQRGFLSGAAGAAVTMCLTSIALVDGPLAVALLSAPQPLLRGVERGMGVYELLFGFRVSSYLYGALVLAPGLIAVGFKKNRGVARALLFVGLAHLTSRVLVAVFKSVVSRPRPFEALGEGDSFPSGHAAHAWSLYFPLAVLFPKYRLFLLVFPALVSAARVAVNLHYPSDVLASAAISALVTWAYARAILERAEE